MRILLAGGGSGGHLFPILAVASAIKKTASGPVELLLVGPNGFSKEVVEKSGISHKRIITGKFRRYWSWQNILDIFRFPIGFLQALWYVYIFMPDVIFGKGSSGSIPTVLVGWLYRIPVLIHDSDAVPGMANRFLSRFAKRVAVSYPAALGYFPEKKRALIGNPVREEILKGSVQKARQFFKLNSSKPVLLIIGGSQGSKRINELVLKTLPQLLEKCQVIHQTGQKNYEEVRKKAEAIPANLRSDYHPQPFLGKEIRDAYAAADLIVCRAGANSLAEIAAWAKPSLLIPLPESANNHQRANAFEFMKAGASVVIEEANLKPHIFQNQVIELLTNPDQLSKMSQKAKQMAKEDAALKIAEELLKLGVS